MIWFDKLESELENIEMDEALIRYREQNSRQNVLKDQVRDSVDNIKINDPERDSEGGEPEPGSALDLDADEEGDATPVRPPAELCIDDDEEKRVQIANLNVDTGTGSANIESQYFSGKDYDMGTIKTCIGRISDLNAKQIEREFRETARNRKVNNIGGGNYKNMTIGQAYYNLNKTCDNFART